KDTLVLPELSSFHPTSTQIQLFNAGQKSYKYRIKTSDSWVKIPKTKGRVEQDKNIEIEVDWKKAPQGQHSTTIAIVADGEHIAIKLPVNQSELKNAKGFIEENGVVSIQAENYSKAVANDSFQWQVIPNLGKTSSGITISPVKISPQK